MLFRRARNILGDEEGGVVERQKDDVAEVIPQGKYRETLEEIVSTQWRPDEEGHGTLFLTVKNRTSKTHQTPNSCDNRWMHFQTEAPTIDQFRRQVMRLPGLPGEDVALALEILETVQNTREKTFLYGRYLEPTTLERYGSKPEQTVIFMSLPIFTIRGPNVHTTNGERDSHPTRSLLQSRYRLESTKKQDKEQVVAQIFANDKEIVHVPQIWALVINKTTLVTCAPMESSVLLGDCIKLILEEEAQLDGDLWSIRITDPEDNVHFLPLQLCGSFLSLIKHVTKSIVEEGNNFAQDQLLSNGPLYKIVTEDDIRVTAESWTEIMEEKRTDLIRLRLIDDQEASERHLVTYRDLEGNEVQYPAGPDDESDDMTDGTKDDSNSDTGETTTSIFRDTDPIAQAVKELIGLRAKVDRAVKRGKIYKVDHLRIHQIPIVEDRILDLIRDAMKLEREEEQNAQATTEAARDRSAVPEGDEQLSPERQQHPYINDERSEADADSEHSHVWDNADDVDVRSEASNPALSENSPKDNPPPSRWNGIKSRVFSGQLKNTSVKQSHSNDTEHGIYWKPSDSQLARSRWDFVRSHIGAYGLTFQSVHHAAKNRSQNSLSSRLSGRLSSTAQSIVTDQNSPVNQALPVRSLRNLHTHGSGSEPDRVFSSRDSQVNPIRRLLHRAKRRTSSPPVVFPVKVPSTKVPSRPYRTTKTPIFLWPAHHDTTDVRSNFLGPRSAGHFEGRKESYQRIPLEENNLDTGVLGSATDQSNMGLLTGEIHANLKSPMESTLDHAVLYRNTILRDPKEVKMFLDDLNIPGAKLHGHSQDTDHPLTPDDELTSMKTRISDCAGEIIYSFIPHDHNAIVISKFWGALYKLLGGTASFCHLLQSIHKGVRTVDGNYQSWYQLPWSLPAAFQHIIKFLVLCSESLEWSEHSWRQIRQAFSECEGLLIEGRKQLIAMIDTDDDRGPASYQAIEAKVLLSLMLSNLINKPFTEEDLHLAELYKLYSAKMKSMVRDQASVRMYDRINLFEEEVEIIKETLEQQEIIIADYQVTVNFDSLGRATTDRTTENIRDYLDGFDLPQKQAESARALAAQYIQLKTESNNKAIVIFTIVTIVFLPLSFVTSYLGMNTADIRNMEARQTLFWSIGVPVTFIVLATALLAAYYGPAIYETIKERVMGGPLNARTKVE